MFGLGGAAVVKTRCRPDSAPFTMSSCLKKEQSQTYGVLAVLVLLIIIIIVVWIYILFTPYQSHPSFFSSIIIHLHPSAPFFFLLMHLMMCKKPVKKRHIIFHHQDLVRLPGPATSSTQGGQLTMARSQSPPTSSLRAPSPILKAASNLLAMASNLRPRAHRLQKYTTTAVLLIQVWPRLESYTSSNLRSEEGVGNSLKSRHRHICLLFPSISIDS